MARVTNRSALGLETPSLTAGHGSGPPPKQSQVACYAWLTRIDRRCSDLSQSERPETVRRARRLLQRRSDDCDWAHDGDLVRYAAAYLEDLATRGPLPGDRSIAGFHPAMMRIRARLPKYANAVWPVLLLGERGTGKGHLLRAVTRLSDTIPLYVPLATMTEGMADSELFGHEKGAFTGADRQRDGLILTAHRSGSPIFLDDFGECPPRIQAKLLTVLDDGVFRPVGSDRMVSVGLTSERRFRIYTSSQPASLAKLRPDLRERLNTVKVTIPPLKERGIDVLLLADRFLREAGAVAGSPVKALSNDARLRLLEHDWPGNVRELRDLMRRADFEADDQDILDAVTLEAHLDEEPATAAG